VLCCAVLYCVVLCLQSKAADEKMTRLAMTEDDEVQMLCEKPVLRQIYDAQVKNTKCVCVWGGGFGDWVW
jgi:hypothetical protein